MVSPPPGPPARTTTPASTARLWRLLFGQGKWIALGMLGILMSSGGMLLLSLLTEPFINVLRGEATTQIPTGFTKWLGETFPRLFSALTPQVNDSRGLVHAMEQVLGALAIAVALMAIGRSMQTYFINAGVQRILRDLRNAIYAHTTLLSMDYFEREQTGQVLAHLTVDIAALRDYLTNALAHFLSLPVLAVGTFTLMVTKSWQLTLLSLFVLPLLAALFWIVGKRVRKAGKRSLGKLGDLSTQLTETVVGMPVVKAFNREEPGYRVFEMENSAAFRAEMTKIKARAIMMAISTIVVTGAIAWLLLVGLKMVEANQLQGEAGALVAFMVLLYMFSDSLQRIGGYWTGYQEMLAAADRIFKFLDLLPTVADAPGTKALTLTEGAAEFRDVRFSYHGVPPWALDGVSFTVPAGKTIALVGRSGSGKSSLAKLLLRFYDPQEGGVYIDGQDIREVTQHSLRERMAFVPQNTLLFSGTIASNIRFGKDDATDEQLLFAAKQANALDFIHGFEEGFDTPVGERGITLSGGQAQRIAIARAILRDPAILILDEATSALDTQGEAVVQEALNRLMEGRTTLVIAHRLSTIQEADEILVLDAGQIVQRGTHEALLAQNGMYRDLYRHAILD